jgi:type II restriction enzyme
MDLDFDRRLGQAYRSGAQRIRRMSEDWFARQMYCAACGNTALQPHPNNARGNDFFCTACPAQYELKSGKSALGPTVPDGAYDTMVRRLEQQGGGPHLALLQYCPDRLCVRDLVLVPAPLLTKDMIVRRPPLGPAARRAGWVGCNIRIGDVPAAGRISVIQNGEAAPPARIVAGMRRAAAVGGSLETRSWLVETLRCIDQLGRDFTLAELYAFEPAFRTRFPSNRHIRPKLRQQLQRLRDAGLIAFLGAGRYRREQ